MLNITPYFSPQPALSSLVDTAGLLSKLSLLLLLLPQLIVSLFFLLLPASSEPVIKREEERGEGGKKSPMIKAIGFLSWFAGLACSKLFRGFGLSSKMTSSADQPASFSASSCLLFSLFSCLCVRHPHISSVTKKFDHS